MWKRIRRIWGAWLAFLRWRHGQESNEAWTSGYPKKVACSECPTYHYHKTLGHLVWMMIQAWSASLSRRGVKFSTWSSHIPIFKRSMSLFRSKYKGVNQPHTTHKPHSKTLFSKRHYLELQLSRRQYPFLRSITASSSTYWFWLHVFNSECISMCQMRRRNQSF